jgi:predicted MFS family arabinose efflux permease
MLGYLSTPRARRDGQLLLLTTALFSAMYARTTLGPVQESIRASLALSDNQMAALQGTALSVPFVVAAIPIGLAVSRLSRVRLICVFALLNLVGSAAAALASNFGTLLALRCLVGLTSTGSWPIICSVLPDLFVATERGRATMFLLIGGVGGGSAAFAVGGALLAVSGSGPDAWRWAMLGLSALLVPITLLLLLMREPPRTEVRIARPSASELCAEFWRSRAVLGPLVAALAMVAGVAEGAAQVWAAPVFSRRFALSPDRIGAMMGLILLVAGLLGPILGGTLADACQRRGGERRIMTALIGCATVGVPAGLFASAPGVWSTGILFAFFMTIAVAFQVMVPVLTLRVVSNELRGSVLSLMSATCMLAAFSVGPMIVSMISSVLGGPNMIGTALSILCAGSCILGVALLASGRRYFPGLGTDKVGDALIGKPL